MLSNQPLPQILVIFGASGDLSHRKLIPALFSLHMQLLLPPNFVVLGVGRTAVWRTRAAYLQGGVGLAVFDMARSGRPRQYGTDDEARVTALACSKPPAGRQRWTMVELERVARQEPGMANVSRETVRRMLKKTISNPGAS